MENEQERVAQPVAWCVTGTRRLYNQYEAEQEAQHCGGSTRAYPVYAEPFIAQPAAHIHTQDCMVPHSWVDDNDGPAVCSACGIAQPEQPKTITDERIRAKRYEFVRTLNPRQFTELWTRNINDQGFFDDLVDAAMAKGGAK